VHDLVETPLDGSHHVFLHEESPSLGFDDCVFPNPLDHSHVSPMYLQPSPSSEYDIAVPVDNPKICDSNVNLGHEDNELNMLGGNIDNCLSLGYFSGYNASLDPYCIRLEDFPGKIT